MRILNIIPTLDHRSGGPAIALAGLASALAKQGQAVTVLVARGDREDQTLIERLRKAGGTVHVGDASRGRVRDLVRACDVCHLHALWEGVVHHAAVACRRLGVPHVFRPCGMLDPWCLNQGRLKKRLYIAWRLRKNLDHCSAMHFTTAIERDLVRPLGFTCPAIVEANGVDFQEFDRLPERGTFRAAHPALGERPIVLFMSRLHRKKGLELLIPAFAQLDVPEAQLVIAGPDQGDYRAEVESMMRAHDLGDRVLFTGMLRGSSRVAALADADLFVLPSHQENFGIVVVESLASGTPVVISDQVNIHREITAAGAGGVVPLDAAALAAEMSRWLGDEQRRADAAVRGAAFVRERYDWNQIAARWVDRYTCLADGRLPDDAEPPGP